MRIVRGADTQIRMPLFEDVTASGEPSSTPSDLAATCVSVDGTTFTDPTTETLETGLIGVTLAAGTHAVRADRLVINVTGTVDSRTVRRRVVAEVVEQPYVWLSEIRAELATDPNGGDVSRFPAWLLEHVRDSLEERIEEYTGRAFTTLYGAFTRPIYDRWVYPPFGPITDVRSLTVDGTAVTVTADMWDERRIDLSGVAACRGGTVAAGVVFGEDMVPERLRRELLAQIRTEVFARGATTPTNAVSESFGGEGPTIRYVLAGEKRPMGTPSFDEYLRSLKTMAIA